MTRQQWDDIEERIVALERTVNGNGEKMGTAQKADIIWKVMLGLLAILCAAIGSLFNAIINGWFK